MLTMNYRNKEKGSASLIVIIFLIIALLGALGFIFWQNVMQNNQTNTETQSTQEVQKDTEEMTVENGRITGSLTYPSEGIPDDLIVYAKNIESDEMYSTDEHLFDDTYEYGVGYSLSVPEGRYYVYAVLSSNPSQEAYYNEFIECGILAECTDTTKIEVVVNAGETTSNIMVGDWWNS